MIEDFCAFILTHGRPDKVYTYKTLRKHGYTGPIYLVIDDEDKTSDQYYNNFNNEVVMFSKEDISSTFDEGDNFSNRATITYARNACFRLAEDLGYSYFIQLDDDYVDFRYKQDDLGNFINKKDILNLDSIFSLLLE